MYLKHVIVGNIKLKKGYPKTKRKKTEYLPFLYDYNMYVKTKRHPSYNIYLVPLEALQLFFVQICP